MNTSTDSSLYDLVLATLISVLPTSGERLSGGRCLTRGGSHSRPQPKAMKFEGVLCNANWC